MNNIQLLGSIDLMISQIGLVAEFVLNGVETYKCGKDGTIPAVTLGSVS